MGKKAQVQEEGLSEEDTTDKTPAEESTHEKFAEEQIIVGTETIEGKEKVAEDEIKEDTEEMQKEKDDVRDEILTEEVQKTLETKVKEKEVSTTESGEVLDVKNTDNKLIQGEVKVETINTETEENATKEEMKPPQSEVIEIKTE